MLRSRRLSYLLAVATAWLPVYFVAFLVGLLVFMFSIGPDGVIPDSGGLPTEFVVIIVLHLITILISLGLVVVYLVDVFRNPDLVDKQDKRVLWVVLIIVAGPFAMPVYWWLYLRPRSESFERRQTMTSAHARSD